jgi:hypothetical protein
MASGVVPGNSKYYEILNHNALNNNSQLYNSFDGSPFPAQQMMLFPPNFQSDYLSIAEGLSRQGRGTQMQRLASIDTLPVS